MGDRELSIREALLESAPDAVISVDAGGRLRVVNSAAERLFGIARLDVLGEHLARLARQCGSQWSELAELLLESSPPDRPVALGGWPPDEARSFEVTVTKAGDPPHITAWIRDSADRADGRVRDALLHAAEELAEVGSWDWKLGESRLTWSDNLFRIFGIDAADIEPTPAYVFSQTHPNDRDRVMRDVEKLRLTGELHPLEYRIVRPDGVVRHLLATLSVAERRNDELRRLVGWVQDVTERRWAEREIAAHVATAAGLTRWDSLEPGIDRLDLGAERLLANLAGALGCIGGAFWVPTGDTLVPRVLWHSGLVALDDFEQATRQSRLPRGRGLPGRVWERREPVAFVGRGVPSLDPRQAVAIEQGLRGAVAVPAISGGEVLAVVELVSREETQLTRRLMDSLTAIGYELGHFLANRRGDLRAPLLTPREREVLQLAAHGLSAERTAQRLVVSPRTVRTHLEHIYSKLRVPDKTAAVASAIRHGLIE